MARCIFCPNELDGRTKYEHVLHNFLGGRKKTRTVDCSTCNERFGGTIDAALSSQVEVIRNMLRLRAGNRRPPPTIKGVSARGEAFKLRSNGAPKFVVRPFVVEKHPDGSFKLEIMAQSREELLRIISSIAAQIGCSEEDVVNQIKKSKMKMISRQIGQTQYNLSFGGSEALRSIVKSCLVLWRTCVGNDELRSEPYEHARSFVLAGGERFNQERVQMDTRGIPDRLALAERFGEFFNLIYVKSDRSGRVTAHFTLYNFIAWRVILADQGGMPDRRIALISNPLDPAKWSENIANEFDLADEWLEGATVDFGFETVNQRFKEIGMQHQEIQMRQAVEDIVDETFKGLGVGNEGVRVQNDVWNAMILEIGTRFAHLVLHLPHERELSSDEISRLLEQRRPP